MAGGPTRDADLSRLNLAAPLSDGQQVMIPARVRPVAAGSEAGASGATGAAGPISLSSATAEQLEDLDGVGPALAARIIAWRDSHGGFSSVDQLDEVPGIGPARMEALRPNLVP
jgi:competence protein ComEA